MENRFTVKDLMLFVFLVVIIIMLALKMVQDDRQWKNFAQIQDTLTAQARQMRTISDAIAAGVPTRAGNDTGGAATGVAGIERFKRLAAARKQPGYATGDWMVDSFASAPPKLNELTAQDIYSRMVYTRVLESLAEYSFDTGKVTPVLAESWEQGADGLSTTFKLRRNVRFSTGDLFTADDVVYSHAQNLNDKIADGRSREYYRKLVRVEKIDDHTVKFHYSESHYENFLRATSISIHSKEFLSKYSDEEIRASTALLVGTGPYKMPDPTKYTPGDQIVLTRNEGYWGLPGPWDRMIWKIIKAKSAEEIEFRNGQLDVFLPEPEQHIAMTNDKALVDRTQHLVYEHVRTGYTYIAWNQIRSGTPTVFADKRVRQAMTLMIDRERIVEELFFGFSSVASGPFSHLGRQADPTIKPWPYDMNRGVELLLEAGFTKTDTGRILRPDGTPFEVEITYGSGSDFLQKIVLALRDNLARGGINLKLNPLEWSIMLERMDSKDFDAIMLGWGAGGLESDIEQMFHSRNIKEADNRNAYSNPALDALIEQAHITLDEDARMKIWQKAHAILHEDQPYTFMFRPQVRVWLDKRIANVQRIPIFGINYASTLTSPLEWYVPLQMQRKR